MKKQLLNYFYFLLINILAKRISWILLIVFASLNLLITVILGTINLNLASNLIIFIVAFIQIIFTIFYSALIYINIFRELEEEGQEIVVLSKPISRKNIYLAKSLFLLLISLFYGLIMLTENLILGLILKVFNYLLIYLIISFFGFILAFNFFGTISSLLAYKLNTKIAMTLPFIVSIPLIVGGIFINNNSTSKANNFAYYLNLPYQGNLAENIANVETFYLNNNKDNFYIVPNGYSNNTFSLKQNEYLNLANNLANNSNIVLSIYSWLSIPYQLIDVFNLENQNLFNNKNSNYLNNYLYYQANDSYLYNYALKKADLEKFNVVDNNQIIKEYLIPSLLKNNAKRKDLINTKIIYARENADKFTVTFPEDKYTFSSSDNLVGDIYWTYIEEVLKDNNFSNYAKKLFKNLITKLDPNLDLVVLKEQIIKEIAKELNDEKSFLNRYSNSLVTLFNPLSVENKTIKNELEKKLYLFTALIYYAYFNLNDQNITKALLANEDDKMYFSPSQFKINLGGFNYFIGGYSSYTPIQEVQGEGENKKVIIRYNLEENNNYLFTPVKDVYELARENQVISKEGYFIIWTVLTFTLITINTFLYKKRDYK
ncbi:ABC transporter permease [Mycoplasmopsis meleagridis]|uniref:ABC transporter permease n=1 Tax=Mycoplasmopsis meleagridis TaxID=29561 RepID=UPI00073D69AF|nr:ABC transporter permease [Mycoplasmopsis meleagridis]KUH47496.1 hypothetical protein ASB56_01370 [Mycoplasmopsis meleagridis]